MTTIDSQGFFLKKYGKASEAFELRQFSLSAPEPDEVVIEVEAFGLNYADVMARKGMYREAPPLPCILGYEVVGTIIHAGANARELEGMRVVAFTRFGGYAKHVTTWSSAVAAIGDMPAETALSLSTQFVTAFYMTNYQSAVYEGNNVLIHAAAGGVGTALIQFCKMKGAIVIAKVGDDAKKELVLKLGADYVVNYNKEPYEAAVEKILAGRKLDISFNPAGGSTFKKDLSLLGAGGKLILFGGSELSAGSAGILSQLNFLRKMGLLLPVALMMGSKSIIGVNMLKVADQQPQVLSFCLNEVVRMALTGLVHPQLGAVYQVSQLAEAHALFESGKTMGKLAVFW